MNPEARRALDAWLWRRRLRSAAGWAVGVALVGPIAFVLVDPIERTDAPETARLHQRFALDEDATPSNGVRWMVIAADERVMRTMPRSDIPWAPGREVCVERLVRAWSGRVTARLLHDGPCDKPCDGRDAS